MKSEPNQSSLLPSSSTVCKCGEPDRHGDDARPVALAQQAEGSSAARSSEAQSMPTISAPGTRLT